MTTPVIFALQFSFSLITYSLLMKWYILPKLVEKELASALTPLLFVHVFRTLGLTSQVPNVVGERLSQTVWAHHVAIGDLVTVILALSALIALRNRWSFAIPLAWVCNIVGFLDVCNAGWNAVQEGIMFFAGVQWLIIVYAVPALIVTHFSMFYLLLKRK